MLGHTDSTGCSVKPTLAGIAKQLLDTSVDATETDCTTATTISPFSQRYLLIRADIYPNG
jgi:hypothetical protein